MANNGENEELLRMALVGYAAEKARLEQLIVDLRARLDQRGLARPRDWEAATAPPTRRGLLSAAARKRIAAAQRKRWAAFHKENAETLTPK
jgi:hypothetical protein